jgi:hypothetical protein
MENRVKDLVRFYLQKHVRETLIELNWIMKTVYRSILLLFIKGVYNYVLIKVNINFIFRKQNMMKTHH